MSELLKVLVFLFTSFLINWIFSWKQKCSPWRTPALWKQNLEGQWTKQWTVKVSYTSARTSRTAGFWHVEKSCMDPHRFCSISLLPVPLQKGRTDPKLLHNYTAHQGWEAEELLLGSLHISKPLTLEIIISIVPQAHVRWMTAPCLCRGHAAWGSHWGAPECCPVPLKHHGPWIFDACEQQNYIANHDVPWHHGISIFCSSCMLVGLHFNIFSKTGWYWKSKLRNYSQNPTYYSRSARILYFNDCDLHMRTVTPNNVKKTLRDRPTAFAEICMPVPATFWRTCTETLNFSLMFFRCCQ